MYNCNPGREQYPSKNDDQLFQMAKDDVDSVYHLEMNLDGINLGGLRAPIRRPFEIAVPARGNILGIPPYRSRGKNTIHIVSDGYWVWLKELFPGDHILRLKGYSPVYRLDVEFHLFVRGPKAKAAR